MKVLPDGKAIDALGAQAEFAVSMALGLPWDGAYQELEEWQRWRQVGHDVSGLEVRATEHRHGRLILHRKDRDAARFVLVTVARPEFTLVGWCLGRKGKREENWADVGYGRPCFYVPRWDLEPIWTVLQPPVP